MNDNVYSMDKLIEFGMTASVAKQMVDSMSTIIKNSNSVIDMTQLHSQNQNVYFLAIDNKPSGVYFLSDIIKMINEKKISIDTLVWKKGMLKWEKIEKFPEIMELIAIQPPALG